MIRLYHGTNLSSAFDIWLHGVNLDRSLPNLDFGKGFYVTDSKRKAIERAYKKTNDYNRRHRCNEEPYLVEILVNNDLFVDMNMRKFMPRELDWFHFVVNNRLSLDFLEQHNIYNHNKDNRYDIVFGEIADGSISDIVNNITQGKYSIEEIDYSQILPKQQVFYENQYSFHTEKSLCCIDEVSCAIINPVKK